MKKEIFAVYFPSWHPDAHYEKWYGKGFSEWELVKSTKPLYEGHKQPRIPEWGWFDESDPKWMAKQIDYAADHGLTGFMFDWYWYEGEQFLERPLNDAFLNAPNRNRLKFFLMWANHNWGIWPALMDNASGMQGNENQSNTIYLTIRHSEEDLRNVMEFCCEKYFRCENYWKIDGKPVYSFYDCNKVFQFVPPADVLRIINEVARAHGFPGIYTLMNIGCCNDNEYFCGWGRIPKMRDAKFDAVFAYNSGLRRDYLNFVEPDRPCFDYGFSAVNQKYCWDRIAEQGLPFMPSITLGVDVSPRWSRKIKYPWDYEKLSYYPINEDVSSEKFGTLLKEALEMNSRAILINAWNEWTEGMALLPDNFYQDRYIRTIAEVTEKHNI